MGSTGGLKGWYPSMWHLRAFERGLELPEHEVNIRRRPLTAHKFVLSKLE